MKILCQRKLLIHKVIQYVILLNLKLINIYVMLLMVFQGTKLIQRQYAIGMFLNSIVSAVAWLVDLYEQIL